MCFDKDVSIRTLLSNLNILITELQNHDNLIINYTNLFTYPSAELLIVICDMFTKVKIYYCKLLKQNILYCSNYKNNKNITVFIKNFYKKWNSKLYIRQIGIFINEIISETIKKHNNYIFNYYINLNHNLVNSTMEEKEYCYKNYIKKHNKLHSNPFNCNHNLKEFNMFNCFICDKCYDLFMIY